MNLPDRPIISGFHPDPSVCRAPDAYYLASSTFEYGPGVPIHRSTDLVHWELVGHALPDAEHVALDGAVASGGIFAPTLRFHDGRFWLITTNLTDQAGHVLVTATDPAGPWTAPVRITTPGIDPDLAWDEQGRCLLTWSGFGAGGPTGIRQVVIDPDAGEVLSEEVPLWNGTGGKFPEGPHLYRRGDWWYLLIAEGGTERGHSVTVARSRSAQGPFEPSPTNPLITARGLDTTVQNTGHGDLVDSGEDRWALVYLGTRPRGASPEWHVLGRETFANEVTWVDDWPVLGQPLQPEPGQVVTDELVTTGPLPGSFIAAAGFPSDVLHLQDGTWVLTPSTAGASFVGRRQTHLYCTVAADLDATAGTGGLQLRIDDRHAVTVQVDAGRVRAVAQVGPATVVLGEHQIDAPTVQVVIRAVPSTAGMFSNEAGPDELVLGVHGTTGFIELGRWDGRYVSTEVASGMTGRIAGLTCTRGSLVAHSFRYTGSDDPANLDLLPAG